MTQHNGGGARAQRGGAGARSVGKVERDPLWGPAAIPEGAWQISRAPTLIVL
jgi:hypothetical protein